MLPQVAVPAGPRYLAGPATDVQGRHYRQSIMYNGLRNGTSGTLQRLLQDLGFNSYKQLQEPNSSGYVQTSETNQHGASEVELSYSSAPHSVAARARHSTPCEVRDLQILTVRSLAATIVSSNDLLCVVYERRMDPLRPCKPCCQICKPTRRSRPR